MAEPPVPSLARARETKIEELSQHFANDDLSLDELERRIERVYKAANVAELETITADLRRATAPPVPVEGVRLASRGSSDVASASELSRSRVLALMSSTRRIGRWSVPRQLDVRAIMSDTRLDLTHASLASPLIDLNVKSVMSQFRIVVPPGMRVIMDLSSFMSDVASRADGLGLDDAPATPNAPVVRVTGFAMMSDVKVIVRRKEETAWASEDDDNEEER